MFTEIKCFKNNIVNQITKTIFAENKKQSMKYELRKQRVERLMRQALIDRQPHKYIQARFILEGISNRISEAERFRNLFIDQIRK